MNFVLMHETVSEDDVIGNDIEIMSKILNEKHNCYVYAVNQFNKNVKYISEQKLDDLLEDEQTIIIYHYDKNWEYGYNKVKNSKCKVVYRYHSIIQDCFAKSYDQNYYSCYKPDISQIRTVLKENSASCLLLDSMYYTTEFNFITDNRIGICPPFNKLEEWGANVPDEKIIKNLIESKNLNVLFSGCKSPGEGYLMLLDIIYLYCVYYDSNIRLKIIGGFDRETSGYNELIRQRIVQYELSSIVEFVGEVDENKLMSYYLGSDVLLCCSKNENFYFPIIAAQFFKLPIIAYNKGTILDTIGKNQLVFDDNLFDYVAALRKIKGDRSTRDFLRNEGYRNYQKRFTTNSIKKRFTKEMKKIVGVEV